MAEETEAQRHEITCYDGLSDSMTHGHSHLLNSGISGDGSGAMGMSSCRLFIEHPLWATGRYDLPT